MIDVLVGVPYAKVEFATESGDIEIEQKALLHDVNMDFDILSIQTTRDIGSDDCATFEIELIYREEWYNNIHGNDLVKIDLGRGYTAEPVLFGMVDNIYKSYYFGDLKPIRTIRISGRGFNKALMQYGVGAVQEINATWGIMGFYGGQDLGFSKGNAAELIQVVMSYYLERGIDMQFANGKHWKDYVEVKYISDESEMSLANVENYYAYQGGLWDYIKELRNAPFNEIYWEVINGKPTFIVRPTPFNPKNWTNLHVEELDDIDIIDEQLGRTDLETYTVYVVKSEHFVDTLNGVYGLPVWYKPNYRKYGLRRLQINSKYILKPESPDRTETGIATPGRNYYLDGEDEMGNRVMEDAKTSRPKFDLGLMQAHQGTSGSYDIAIQEYPELEQYLELKEQSVDGVVASGGQSSTDVSQKTVDLFNWNIKNNKMENGNITVKGHVNYKVGTRLYMASSGIEYYIENVSHSFMYNENWKTTLGVTRGINPNERFTKPWNQWTVMTAEDVAEITGITQETTEIQTSDNGVQGVGNAETTTEAPTNTTDSQPPSGDSKMVSPTGGKIRITSPYGDRIHPIDKVKKFHAGVDIAGANGSPMYAAMGGTIEFAGNAGNGLGNYIVINHGNGLTTLYGHAHSVGVTKGQKVESGELIGKIGSTGNVTGPHIHFEVKKDGKLVNPAPYLE